MPFHGQGTPNFANKGRSVPPGETSQEATYLKALGEKQTPVSIKLADGEVVSGWIEYYDPNMERLTRDGQANLFIFKDQIMYIAEDGTKRKETRHRSSDSSIQGLFCCASVLQPTQVASL